MHEESICWNQMIFCNAFYAVQNDLSMIAHKMKQMVCCERCDQKCRACSTCIFEVPTIHHKRKTLFAHLLRKWIVTRKSLYWHTCVRRISSKKKEDADSTLWNTARQKLNFFLSYEPLQQILMEENKKRDPCFVIFHLHVKKNQISSKDSAPALRNTS